MASQLPLSFRAQVSPLMASHWRNRARPIRTGKSIWMMDSSEAQSFRRMPACRWIGREMVPHHNGSGQSLHTMFRPVPRLYNYRTSFVLPGNFVPGSAKLTGQYGSLNELVEVFVNTINSLHGPLPEGAFTQLQPLDNLVNLGLSYPALIPSSLRSTLVPSQDLSRIRSP